MMEFKAQFWSFDLIFAMVIFSVALTILAFTWFSVTNQLALSYGGGSSLFQLRTDSFTQTVLSEGSPTDWYDVINTTNSLTWSGITVGLGASQTNTTLSSAKIDALISMQSYDYNATKQALGAPYEYFITITSPERYGAGINMSIGKNPASFNAVTIGTETRSAVLNGRPVSVSVELWTNQPAAVS